MIYANFLESLKYKIEIYSYKKFMSLSLLYLL